MVAEAQPLLSLQDIQFSYKRGAPVIQGVDLDVARGEIIGISGENGSGKSTLLKLIVGMLRPQAGALHQHGRIGYSPQQILLFDHLTVDENFMVFGQGLGLPAARIRHEASQLMEALQFAQYADQQVSRLSGGTQQKLNFSLGLLGDPDVLVLDEPYQGLDHASFLKFWEMQHNLRRHGKSVIIVSHLIEDQERFTRAIHLVEGRLQSCTRPDCDCCGC